MFYMGQSFNKVLFNNDLEREIIIVLKVLRQAKLISGSRTIFTAQHIDFDGLKQIFTV